MSYIRLGIIGIGNMGSEHCRSILSGKTPEVVLSCVADVRAERRAWAKGHLPNVDIYESGSALIAANACDAVLISTPHYLHPDLAIEAMRAGLHVLCEKPIAVYTQAGRAMIDVAEQTGVVFALMFNQRTNCVYRRLKQLLDSSELGDIKRVSWIITDWYRTQMYYDSGAWRATWAGEGGGVLLNQCPHQLDLLQWLCGMPTEVRAVCHEGRWHDIEVEDDVSAYLQFANGATGVFIASTGDMPGVNRLEITCDRGRVLCEHDRLQLFRSPVSERELCRTSADPYPQPPIEETVLELDGQNPQHVGVINAFAAHILHGEPLVATGSEGLNGLLISNAMHLSAWLDRPVTLPFDEQFFLSLLNERRARSRHKQVQDVTIETDHTAGGRTLA